MQIQKQYALIVRHLHREIKGDEKPKKVLQFLKDKILYLVPIFAFILGLVDMFNLLPLYSFLTPIIYVFIMGAAFAI